jgi:hypothetical protein
MHPLYGIPAISIPHILESPVLPDYFSGFPEIRSVIPLQVLAAVDADLELRFRGTDTIAV